MGTKEKGAALPPLAPACDPAGSDAWFLALWSAVQKEEADLEAALSRFAIDDIRADAIVDASCERRRLIVDLVRRSPAAGIAGALVKARLLIGNGDINDDGALTIDRGNAYTINDTPAVQLAASLWADLEALGTAAGIPAYEGVLSVADIAAAKKGGAA